MDDDEYNKKKKEILYKVLSVFNEYKNKSGPIIYQEFEEIILTIIDDPIMGTEEEQRQKAQQLSEQLREVTSNSHPLHTIRVDEKKFLELFNKEGWEEEVHDMEGFLEFVEVIKDITQDESLKKKLDEVSSFYSTKV
jgi:hypothetical protein